MLLRNRILLEAAIFNRQTANPSEQTASIFGVPSDAANGQFSDVVLRGNTVFPFVQNGNFSDGITGWSTQYSNLSVASNTLTVTGIGTNSVAGFSRNLGSAGTASRKIFFRMKARVTNSSCTRISANVLTATEQNLVTNPVANQWYTVSGIFTSSGSYQYMAMYHGYADAATANGKVMEVQEVMAIDLNAHGIEALDAAACNTRFPSWLSYGTKSTLGGRVKSVGKNLFNTTDFINYIKKYDTTSFVTDDNGERVVDFIPSTTNTKPFMKGMFEPNTKYTIKVSTKMLTGDSIYFRFMYTDGTLSNLAFTSSLSYVTLSGTSVAGKSIDYFYASYGSSGYRARVKLDSIQIEKGTGVTTYEPHTSTELYFDTTLRSVPTAKDELNIVGTQGRKVQRVKNYQLVESDIASFQIRTNVDWVVTKSRTTNGWLPDMYGSFTNGVDNFISIDGKIQTTSSDDVSKIGQYFTFSDGQIYFIVAKGTYANLAAAQAGMVGTSINYQLATPQTSIIPITITDQDNQPVQGLKCYGAATTITVTPTDSTNSTSSTVTTKYPV